MTDWKIAVVVLLGLLLITFGVFSESGMTKEDIGGKIVDIIFKNFPLKMPSKEGGNVTVRGEVYLDTLDLKTLPLEYIKVSYYPEFQTSDLILADTKLKTKSYTELELSNYEGTFLLNGSKITLMGTAETASVNGINLETVKKLIPVKVNVEFENVYVKNLKMTRLEMEDVVGEVNINEKISVTLRKEPMKFEGFYGNLNITKNGIKINGIAKRLFISGEDYTASIS